MSGRRIIEKHKSVKELKSLAEKIAAVKLPEEFSFHMELRLQKIVKQIYALTDAINKKLCK